MNKHYKGEIGTKIVVDCGCDISGATQVLLRVKKPDKSIVVWRPEIYNKNYLKYIVQNGDFDLPGTYYLQAYIQIGGWTGLGETCTFLISPEFD